VSPGGKPDSLGDALDGAMLLTVYITGCAVACITQAFLLVLAYSRLNATMWRSNLNRIGIEPQLEGGFSTTLDYNPRRDLAWRLLRCPLDSLLSWALPGLIAYRLLVVHGFRGVAAGTPQRIKELYWKLHSTEMREPDVARALLDLYGDDVAIFIQDGRDALELMQERKAEERGPLSR
jgi:hypothetical protein